MSSTVDVNILLHASDRGSRFHSKALSLVEKLALGPNLLYLFWPVIMGYLRIATHASIFDKPLSTKDALDNIEQLLELPHVRAP